MYDLFSDQPNDHKASLVAGLHVFRSLAVKNESSLLSELEKVFSLSPLRPINTPGGGKMSVQMSNCGSYGWISDEYGYRYASIDPLTAKPWPRLPAEFLTLVNSACKAAGFANFVPNACVINRYEPGAKMSLHQDKNEADFTQPIVSVSLGLPAVFLFGGKARADKPERILLNHGDVIVWGGESRLNFHGIEPIRSGYHPLTGPVRYNLTFRKAK